MGEEMTGQVTWDQLAYLAGGMVGLFGIVAWLYVRFEAKFAAIEDKAEKVASQLSEYKTHVAESYVSKAGLREFRDEVMGGVREIKQSVTHLNDRIDTILTSTPARRAAAPK